jgi:hypothetical protein
VPELGREQPGHPQLEVHAWLGVVWRGERPGPPTDEAVDQIIEALTGGGHAGEGVAVAGRAGETGFGGADCPDELAGQRGGFWEGPSFRGEVLIKSDGGVEDALEVVDHVDGGGDVGAQMAGLGCELADGRGQCGRPGFGVGPVAVDAGGEAWLTAQGRADRVEVSPLRLQGGVDGGIKCCPGGSGPQEVADNDGDGRPDRDIGDAERGHGPPGAPEQGGDKDGQRGDGEDAPGIGAGHDRHRGRDGREGDDGQDRPVCGGGHDGTGEQRAGHGGRGPLQAGPDRPAEARLQHEHGRRHQPGAVSRVEEPGRQQRGRAGGREPDGVVNRRRWSPELGRQRSPPAGRRARRPVQGAGWQVGGAR